MEDRHIAEIFYLGVTVTKALADTSDFEEGEIRCLYPQNPVPLSKIENWDKKLIKGKQPVQCDLGMDKERNIYHYYGGKWKQLNKK